MQRFSLPGRRAAKRLPTDAHAPSIARCALMASVALVSISAGAEERPAFERAERFTFQRQGEMVANADIATHWIAGRDSFWYRQSKTNGDKEFVLVDAATGRTMPAFDHGIIARGLATTLKRPVTAHALPFRRVSIFCRRNIGGHGNRG